MDAHRVWAQVDLDALTHNLERIRACVERKVALMLVVKADAYGHGAVAVAHHALRSGVQALGVGTSAEALELRQAGVRAPILVLGTIVDEEAVACLRHGIHIALHSLDRCRMLQELAVRLACRARVHVKIDTGMGRLGVLPERALDLLSAVRGSSHLSLCGIMTHIAAPEGGRSAAALEQLVVFDSVLRRARERSLASGWIHAANSACIFTGLGTHYDAVRPGISAYGVLPDEVPGVHELRPVLSLHTQVVFLKDVPAGSLVGYASTWHAPTATRIATLPVGYSDGLPWHLGNRGEVLVRGRRAPIVGRVSMDYTTVDVGHIPGVQVGDRVTLIGTQERESLGLADVARRAGTIPYEIACAVGRRVERLYLGAEHDDLALREAAAGHEPAVPAARVGDPRITTPTDAALDPAR